MENIETLQAFKERINKEADSYWDSYRDSIGKFDHQSLYISSGALGFSLTFVKEIVPFNKSIFIWIFILSICSFLATIILGFINQLISSETMRYSYLELENFTPENELIEGNKLRDYHKKGVLGLEELIFHWQEP